jgi:hypothetical protein
MLVPSSTLQASIIRCSPFATPWTLSVTVRLPLEVAVQFENHLSGLLLTDESLNLLLFHTLRLTVITTSQPTARDMLVLDMGPQYEARG